MTLEVIVRKEGREEDSRNTVRVLVSIGIGKYIIISQLINKFGLSENGEQHSIIRSTPNKSKCIWLIMERGVRKEN